MQKIIRTEFTSVTSMIAGWKWSVRFVFNLTLKWQRYCLISKFDRCLVYTDILSWFLSQSYFVVNRKGMNISSSDVNNKPCRIICCAFFGCSSIFKLWGPRRDNFSIVNRSKLNIVILCSISRGFCYRSAHVTLFLKHEETNF